MLFDPEERYIWALLPAPDGASTSRPATRARSTASARDGAATAVLTAEETHVLSLALGKDGVLYAGSGGNGYVYRRDPRGQDHRAARHRRQRGQGARARRRRATSSRPAPAARPAAARSRPRVVLAGRHRHRPRSSTTTPARDWPRCRRAGRRRRRSRPPRRRSRPVPVSRHPARRAYASPGQRQSWLYRIRKDGLPEELWRSDSETVHAMVLLGSKAILGTGDEGKVLSVDPVTGRASILLDLPGRAGHRRSPCAARVSRRSPPTSPRCGSWTSAPAPEGTYTSPVLDAGHFATWGRLDLAADGRRARPRPAAATPRSPAPAGAPGRRRSGEVKSPKGRYLQYRLTLAAPARRRPPPEVRQVELAYPALQPGAARRQHHRARSARRAGLERHRRERARRHQPHAAAGPRHAASPAPPSTEARPPARAGDPGRAQRALGGRRSERRRPLVLGLLSRRGRDRVEARSAEDLEEPLPQLRLDRASRRHVPAQGAGLRRPSNPDGRALRSDLVSSPSWSTTRRPGSSSCRSPATADADLPSRPRSPTGRASSSGPSTRSTAAPWQAVDPDDQVFDEREETISIAISPTPPAGEHTLVLRAEDAARNVGSAKLVVRDRRDRERSKHDEDEP